MKVVRWVAAIVGLCLLAWVGFGLFVLSRNRFPDLRLPAPLPPPANNVYDRYVECVHGVKEGARLAELEKLPDYGAPAQKQSLLAQNREVLQKFHQLMGQPCGVTHDLPQPGDPFADDFRGFARLIAAEGKLSEQQGRLDRALDVYLDGLTFVEDVVRGGNIFHAGQVYLAQVALFQAVPPVVPRVSAAAAEKGAQRLEKLLKNQYPLKAVFEQQYRVAMEGWRRTVSEMSMRGFRLKFAQNPAEKQFLYLPKQPLIEALRKYMEDWVKQASQPYPNHQVVEYPAGVQEGAVPNSQDLETLITRYTYKDTRLRLLCTALRLEAYRKRRGSYPARLSDLGASPWFTDPFSSKPFVYRPQGSTYTLYSVGPNGEDDGGSNFHEGRMHRRPPGDLTLVPTFGGPGR